MPDDFDIPLPVRSANPVKITTAEPIYAQGVAALGLTRDQMAYLSFNCGWELWRDHEGRFLLRNYRIVTAGYLEAWRATPDSSFLGDGTDQLLNDLVKEAKFVPAGRELGEDDDPPFATGGPVSASHWGLFGENSIAEAMARRLNETGHVSAETPNGNVHIYCNIDDTDPKLTPADLQSVAERNWHAVALGGRNPGPFPKYNPKIVIESKASLAARLKPEDRLGCTVPGRGPRRAEPPYVGFDHALHEIEERDALLTGSKPTNPKDAVGITKPRWFSYIPLQVLVGVGMAFYEGARKYGKMNWRAAGVRSSVYIDAAVNGHIARWQEGEDIDEASGVHHIEKAIACLIIMRDSELQGNMTDDRPIKGKSMAAALAKGEELVALLTARHPNAKQPYTEVEHGDKS